MTKSQLCFNACLFRRKTSRTLRFTRFLCTALPTRLETAKPSRECSKPLGRTWNTKVGVTTFLPFLKIYLNSDDFRIRFALRSRLSGKSLSSRGTACSNHITPAGGFHAGPKTMGFGTFSAVGLIRSFHDPFSIDFPKPIRGVLGCQWLPKHKPVEDTRSDYECQSSIHTTPILSFLQRKCYFPWA